MNYKAPFYAVNLSLYKALSDKKDMECNGKLPYHHYPS